MASREGETMIIMDRIKRVREKKVKRCQLRKQLHKVLKKRGKGE